MQAPRARKRFGQNFLKDQSIISRIASSIAPKSCDHIVEIGPGYGALTEALIDQIGRLDVIELDRDLVPYLLAAFSTREHFHLHQGDALRFDYSRLQGLAPSQSLEKKVNNLEQSCGQKSSFRVVGNLPYNISTPLLFHLLGYRKHIQDMHFMLQLEVVKRLTAVPDDKLYGRLSVMIQYFCHTALLFEVPPESFDPPPKVQSAIVKIEPRQTISTEVVNYQYFENLVRQAFSMRRKTLRNALKPFCDMQILDATFDTLSLAANLRAENLSVDQYVALANQLYKVSH